MKKKNNKKLSQYISAVGVIIIGFFFGFWLVTYISTNMEDAGLLQQLVFLIIVTLSIYLGLILHIVVHEAGHLIFGLMSGYGFSSFRIFNFMWVKEEGRIKLKRYSVAGTAGQCLMSPPELVDGKMPVMLYNFGGSLLNLIFGIIFLVLYLLVQNIFILSALFLMLTVWGFLMAAMNGIPMRTATVDNDGYNAFALRRNEAAVGSFWMQLKVSQELAEGARLRDLPEEWFKVPSDEAMKNSMVVVQSVFACNRLMDQQYFEEADRLMKHIMDIDSGMVNLHRNLLMCDRIYCELIGENRPDVLGKIFTKELEKFMETMKTSLTVMRTKYVYALLAEKNMEKAQKLRSQLEKAMKKHPYPGDVQSELELVKIAENMVK